MILKFIYLGQCDVTESVRHFLSIGRDLEIVGLMENMNPNYRNIQMPDAQNTINEPERISNHVFNEMYIKSISDEKLNNIYKKREYDIADCNDYNNTTIIIPGEKMVNLKQNFSGRVNDLKTIAQK